jgi:hypothetical protein
MSINSTPTPDADQILDEELEYLYRRKLAVDQAILSLERYQALQERKPPAKQSGRAAEPWVHELAS